ncbi:unnamed protein product [Microthlaspi erraticum]|uniref:Reverse transcriptase domain-containing protein n=1 Tax=Microthlaspi erraticum TaxID=1685480 RepID=A0A6D2JSV7_9BRAS|nr:unnamed protein product [Microthlaspi erraticum]
MIDDCGLVDFPSHGNTLSWRGRRWGKIVRCRLDRALATEDWHNIFPKSHVEYLKMVGSDHRPILATIDDKIPKGRCKFRFAKDGSGKTASLQRLNGDGRINDITGNSKVQNDDRRTQEELVEITQKLKEAYRNEEQYWKQKSRNLWLKDGDLNTKFYHATTKQRRAINRLVGLHNKSDVWVSGDKEIEKVAVDYFTELFMTTSPDNFTEALEGITGLITEADNTLLTSPATEEEVRLALFLMNPEKAPGPDGMMALFFQRSWPLIKTDMVGFINDFLTSDKFDERLNRTNICLIPKTERPTRMTELRPISLCNVGYKIVSKVLCQRLKKVLPQLISETQSAFVPGRLISDNILIAQEMFHGLRTNKSCKGKYMAVKTDMSKAYISGRMEFCGGNNAENGVLGTMDQMDNEMH